MIRDPAAPPDGGRSAPAEDPLQAIREALRRLRFGTISLTVHDARIVQIDITEKKRFGTG